MVLIDRGVEVVLVGGCARVGVSLPTGRWRVGGAVSLLGGLRPRVVRWCWVGFFEKKLSP